MDARAADSFLSQIVPPYVKGRMPRPFVWKGGASRRSALKPAAILGARHNHRISRRGAQSSKGLIPAGASRRSERYFPGRICPPAVNDGFSAMRFFGDLLRPMLEAKELSGYHHRQSRWLPLQSNPSAKPEALPKTQERLWRRPHLKVYKAAGPCRAALSPFPSPDPDCRCFSDFLKREGRCTASRRHVSASPLRPLSASFFRPAFRSAACFVLFLWNPVASPVPGPAGGFRYKKEG